MTDPTTCSRPGCEKKLRSSNTKGVCATGCRSPEAPPATRAKGTRSASSPRTTTAAQPRDESIALDRFRLVAEALGKSPDAILSEFAQAWLDELAAKVGG